MTVVFLGFYAVQCALFDPVFRRIVMYLFQGCNTLLRNGGTKHTAQYTTPPPPKKKSYEQRTQKLENLDTAPTYCQEENNARTGMYKLKKNQAAASKF
jgi:hypothetical protein